MEKRSPIVNFSSLPIPAMRATANLSLSVSHGLAHVQRYIHSNDRFHLWHRELELRKYDSRWELGSSCVPPKIGTRRKSILRLGSYQWLDSMKVGVVYHT